MTIPIKRGSETAFRFYLLLALFDRRDGSALGGLVQMAREAYEREDFEDDAWDLFDRTWDNLTPGQRLEMAKRWSVDLGRIEGQERKGA